MTKFLTLLKLIFQSILVPCKFKKSSVLCLLFWFADSVLPKMLKYTSRSNHFFMMEKPRHEKE